MARSRRRWRSFCQASCAAHAAHPDVDDHAAADDIDDFANDDGAAAATDNIYHDDVHPGMCALRSKCEVEAAVFFRDALANEPCCLEAVPELLRLGAKEEDIRALLQVSNINVMNISIIIITIPPLQPILSQTPFIASWLRALSSQVSSPPALSFPNNI